MKEFNLRFFIERRWPDKLDNLLEIDEEDLPTTSGTYILGSSPIFYMVSQII